MKCAKRMRLVPEQDYPQKVAQIQLMDAPPERKKAAQLEDAMHALRQDYACEDVPDASERYLQLHNEYLKYNRPNQPYQSYRRRPQPFNRVDKDVSQSLDISPPNMDRMVLESLPKHYRQKGQLLLDTLKQRTSDFSWNSKGEIIDADGQTLKGTNVVDLVREAFVPKVIGGKGFEPFMKGLARANVPVTMFGKTSTRKELERLQNEGAPTYIAGKGKETPSWLPY